MTRSFGIRVQPIAFTGVAATLEALRNSTNPLSFTCEQECNGRFWAPYREAGMKRFRDSFRASFDVIGLVGGAAIFVGFLALMVWR
jgi:hypothetical protein